MDRQHETRTIHWLQVLRAVAAGMVALKHILHEAISNGLDPAGGLAWLHGLLPWDAGVDIFFVISGFVIVHSSTALFGRHGGAAAFLRRRLTRVVPLYWLMTSLLLGVLAVQPGAVRGAAGDVVESVGIAILSYLFIPWPRPDGLVQPILGLGWTLNHEMFFYVVMSGFITLPRRAAVLGCAGLLTALVLLGLRFAPTVQPLAFWVSPIVLEFVFGMLIALIHRQLPTPPAWVRLGLAVVAVAALRLQLEADGTARVVAWGLPGALLVVAAVIERRGRTPSRGTTALVRLGDASYAMYLVHPFAMRVCSMLAHRLGWQGEAAGIGLVLAGLALAQGAALLLHRYVEQPVSRGLRASRRLDAAPGRRGVD